MIWMFPYQIPNDKDVEIVVMIVDFVYLRVFHPISHFMVFIMIKNGDFLSLPWGRLGFLSLESKKSKQEDGNPNS